MSGGGYFFVIALMTPKITTAYLPKKQYILGAPAKSVDFVGRGRTNGTE